MDKQADEKRFGALIDRLHAVTSGGFNANEATKAGMWTALKDVDYNEIKTNAERIMAGATRETRFPPPSALRNRPPPFHAPVSSPMSERAQRQSTRNWEELKHRDPISYEIEWRAARAFTAMAQCLDGSDEHREWTREYQRWGRLRYAPRAEQETWVHAYLGTSTEKRNEAGDARLPPGDRE